MRTSPHAVQRSTWPPSAAVRHSSMALITRRSTRPRWPAWARLGIAVAAEDVRHFQTRRHGAAGSGGGTTSSVRRSSGLAVRRMRPVETCV